MRFLSAEWHQRLTSTNTVLVERLEDGEELPSGFVLATREQMAGRGRYERKWISGAGKNLTFSFLLRTRIGPPHLLSLPMAVALGVVAMLEEYGIRGRTKWPNDVWVGKRKICGILAERKGDGLVVGVGLNINMKKDETRGIDRPATSLGIETGEDYSVDAVLERLLGKLSEWIERWEEGDFGALREAWLADCVGLGEEVEVGEGQGRRVGVLEGFGDAGQLLLRGKDGGVREMWSGDLGVG